MSAEKKYPYGNQLVEDGVLDNLDGWDIDKDINLYIADHVFDYVWEIKDDGSIILTDRGYYDGIEDRTTKIREVTNELELTFGSMKKLSSWINEKIKKIS